MKRSARRPITTEPSDPIVAARPVPNLIGRRPDGTRLMAVGPGGDDVSFFRSGTEPHVGILFKSGPDLEPSPIQVGDAPGRLFLVVRVEDHHGRQVLRDPRSGNYLYRSETPDEQQGDLTWKGSAHQIPFHFDLTSRSSDLPEELRTIAGNENAGRAITSPEQMLALLQAPSEARLQLFWALFDVLTKEQVLALLPVLPEASGYARIFEELQSRLSKGDGKFPLDTGGQLFEFVQRFGWKIGKHSYGRPFIIEENAGHLTIGKYCSIAAFATLVLGNHTTRTATSYPFAQLKDYWPQALVGVGLVDHVGRDIVIGNDVWIGHGAVVLPGARIGHGAVLGANCVARGTVPPYAIVAGNPGKVVGFRFSESIIERLLALAWWDWPDEKVDRFIALLLDGNIENFLSAAEADRRVTLKPSLLGHEARVEQSSLFRWSERESASADAAGLISGRLTGGYQNHTDFETDPWWQIDLGAEVAVSEIAVFNRMDPNTAGRANGLTILASDDRSHWRTLARHEAAVPFGGIDGRPFRWFSSGETVRTRHIRLLIPGATYLHLDQVQIS